MIIVFFSSPLPRTSPASFSSPPHRLRAPPPPPSSSRRCASHGTKFRPRRSPSWKVPLKAFPSLFRSLQLPCEVEVRPLFRAFFFHLNLPIPCFNPGRKKRKKILPRTKLALLGSVSFSSPVVLSSGGTPPYCFFHFLTHLLSLSHSRTLAGMVA